MEEPVPIQALLVLTLPILTTTHTAHDVKLYTKAKGKYVANVQQQRSALRAHLRADAIALACVVIYVVLKPIELCLC
jgi:hypothetical protein